MTEPADLRSLDAAIYAGEVTPILRWIAHYRKIWKCAEADVVNFLNTDTGMGMRLLSAEDWQG